MTFPELPARKRLVNSSRRCSGNGVPLPKPLSIVSGTQNTSRGSLQDQQRVSQDNLACSFVLDQVQLMVERGGGTIRENPRQSPYAGSSG